MPHDRNEFIGQGPDEEQMKTIVESLQKGVGSNNDEKLFKNALAAKSRSEENQVKSTDPNKVKQVRMLVDHLMIQSKNISSTREVSLAYTNMQRGFMWLGKVLQGLDQPNPYPESTNVYSSKIEERTDQAKDSPATFEGFDFNANDKIATIKWFRDKLDGVISQIDFGYGNRAANNAEDAFAEAKMWFGQELNNIRLASV